MKYTKLYSKTRKSAPKNADSVNARLLIQAGFVDQLMAGVFSYLPLGLRVLKKIENVIREKMEAVDGREILMPALHPKENWQKTGRWDGFDALFKVQSHYKKEYGLGPTHEEVVVPLARTMIKSYRDLPLYLYQIQTKFRDEPRPKAGLARGREFLMKDLYSFHADEDDLDIYYEKMKETYQKIFKRCGLKSLITEASGGTFSKFSHEFQVAVETGEDTIYTCDCGFSRNKEIIEDTKKCPECGKKLKKQHSSEVGNIFKLKTKYSEPFDLHYLDRSGKKQAVIMGCYGIGISRIMATIVEVRNDKHGIIWPEAVAPYQAHLIALTGDKVVKAADILYDDLRRRGVEVLYDDRVDVSAGEKFADADLIGCPARLVISEKTLQKNAVEYKKRDSEKIELIDFRELISKL